MAKKKNDKEDEERYLLLLCAEDLRAFTAPETEGERIRLSQFLEAKRQSLAATPALLDQYVVELIHRCPNFLDGAVGFAWVEQHYKILLQRVRMMPNTSKKYWNEMMPKVRKSFMPRGRRQSTHNRQRDVDQTMGVHIRINQGMKKTEAVTNLIKAAEKNGVELDQKEVFRALKRIEQQGAGTWQAMLNTPNTEKNQKNIVAFYAMLKRQSNPKTATADLTPTEKAFIKTLSIGFEKNVQNDIRTRKMNARDLKRKK